ICVCSYRSSVTATSDHPVSSGLPTLPMRRPGQDHRSGAVCARLPRAESAGRLDSLAPARDAILDTHGESSAPPSQWLLVAPPLRPCPPSPPSPPSPPPPQASGLGYHLDPAVPQFERFAGCPATTSALIQLRRKAGELSSQDFYNARVYHVINVVRKHKRGQLFIYDDWR